MVQSTAVAVVDPATASAVQIREWSIAVRAQIPQMSSDELGQLEALLLAVKHRLKQLGKDISETERTRIRAVQRMGELLGPPRHGLSDDRNSTDHELRSSLSHAENDRNHKARLLAAYPGVVDEALAKAKAPDGLDSISFVPTLLGGDQKVHEYLYWEFHERGFSQAALYQGRWKGVRSGNPDAPIVLYDLKADLGEKRDVASANPELAAKIGDWLKSARSDSPDWIPSWTK